MMERLLRCRHTIVGGLLLTVGASVVLANYSVPFKEVAGGDATIVTAKCKVGDASPVECTAQESIRGRVPGKPIRISRERWANYGLLVLDPQANSIEFLLILTPDGKLGCHSDLPTLTDAPICIVPIVNGKLSRSYRTNYDRTEGGPLTLDQVKSQLLAAPRQTK